MEWSMGGGGEEDLPLPPVTHPLPSLRPRGIDVDVADEVGPQAAAPRPVHLPDVQSLLEAPLPPLGAQCHSSHETVDSTVDSV